MKKLLALLMAGMLVLSACGSTETETEEATPAAETETGSTETETAEETNEPEVAEEESEKVVEEEKEEVVEESADSESSVGKTAEEEFGTTTVVKEKKGITDLVYEDDNIKLEITDVQISKLDISDDYLEFFQTKSNEATSVVVAVNVENKSDSTISIYPDQMTIVTDTKEQKEADMFLSDHIGGDFIGKVQKSGNVVFILDSNAEEISHVKLVAPDASDENFETVSENIQFELDI